MAESFALNTGARIPSVGLGTWQIEPGVVGNALYAAIKAGYRHIDCAPPYRNEKEVGLALKKLFEDGVVKREDLFITSKLWAGDHAPEDVPEAIGTTLKDLQLDYLDLYLIHGPIRIKKGTMMSPENFLPPDIPATWGAMEKLYASGKARAIGVSNFSCKKLEDLLAVARVPPAVNQVECHPVWQQDKLRKLCQWRGVHLSAFSPLGSPGLPGVNGASVLSDPIVNSVAEQLHKTPAQVALRWGLQMGQSVLPKSANETRIKENFDIFDWSIPEDLMAKFSEIKQAGYRHIDCAPAYRNEKEIGLALKKLFEDGVVKREDLFITSKLWSGNQAPEDVPEGIDTTLEDLQLDYLDLFLIHAPLRSKKGAIPTPENFLPLDIPGTWEAMEKLYNSGKARAIGVSNFSCKKMEDLLAIARVPPAVNQVESHPGWQQMKLRELCLSKGVHLSAYSPLGKPGSPRLEGPSILSNPIVISVAERLQKTPAQVALRWGLQMGQSVLPKSTNEARIEENLNIFDWSIPEDLMVKFSEMQQIKTLRADFVVHAQGIYRTVEDFWDCEI